MPLPALIRKTERFDTLASVDPNNPRTTSTTSLEGDLDGAADAAERPPRKRVVLVSSQSVQPQVLVQQIAVEPEGRDPDQQVATNPWTLLAQFVFGSWGPTLRVSALLLVVFGGVIVLVAVVLGLDSAAAVVGTLIVAKLLWLGWARLIRP